MIGILANHRAQAPIIQEFGLVFLQVQYHIGAAAGLGDVSNGEAATAIGLPAHAPLGGLTSRAAQYRDLVSDDEGGVEADAELAYQLGITGLIAGQVAEKFRGAGTGDGAQMLDGLIPRITSYNVCYTKLLR